MAFAKKTATVVKSAAVAAKPKLVAVPAKAVAAKPVAAKPVAVAQSRPVAAKPKLVAVAKTAAAPKPEKIVFDAPSDMRPCFIELMFRTQEDGLIGPSFKCLRVKGNWTNPEAKRFDMMEYDAATVVAIISRVAARTFATNASKRLPANSAFRLVIRAGARKADGTLIGGIKSVSRLVRTKQGASHWKELVDKTDPVYRKIRSVSRFIPGAFVNLQLPPSGRRPKKGEDNTDTAE